MSNPEPTEAQIASRHIVPETIIAKRRMRAGSRYRAERGCCWWLAVVAAVANGVVMAVCLWNPAGGINDSDSALSAGIGIALVSLFPYLTLAAFANAMLDIADLTWRDRREDPASPPRTPGETLSEPHS